MKHELIYRIGISLVPGIGVINAKNLIAHCGNAEAVFRESKRSLKKISGIGEKVAGSIFNKEILLRAEQEVEYAEKHNVKILYYLDQEYPKRLKLCEDSPVILYQKGEAQLNNHHVLAFVGSRSATDYGKEFCREFITHLPDYDPLIVSGLAYGIDIASHKAALENNIPTVAVLGHGLDRIYPYIHRNTVERMLESGGGLLTEFMSGTNPDRENFPKRNRIVAGLSDAVVVVEAAIKGGALITAEIANSYNREVFAVPGRLQDEYSAGCNYLIKSHKAALLSKPEDLSYILGWEQLRKEQQQENVQRQLFVDLSEEEQKLMGALSEFREKMELDNLCNQMKMPVSKVLPLLMTMELKGVVRSLPGKVYELCG